MDRDDLVVAVKRRLRIPDTGEGLLTDTVLVGFVNEGVRQFGRERDWPWLLTSANVSVTTAGTGPLPADFRLAHTVRYQNNLVRKVGLAELLAGQTRYVWTDNGASLMVEPAPTATSTFVLWYYRAEPELDGGTDEPLAPAQHQDAIVAWAAMLGARSRRDDDLGDRLEREYAGHVARSAGDVFRLRGGGLRVTRRDELNTSTAVW